MNSSFNEVINCSQTKLKIETIIDSLKCVAENDKCTLYFKMSAFKQLVYRYKDIWDSALCFAEHLTEKGIQYKDRVVIILNTSPEFLIVFYGVLLAGGVPVPIAPPSFGLSDISYYLSRLKFVLEKSDAKFLATIESDIQVFKERGDLIENNFKFININAVDLTRKMNYSYYHPKSDDLCFVQYTSGSTGIPKGVPLTHENIIANIESIGESIRINNNDSGISWMPLYHDMGLIGGMLIQMYYEVETMVFMNPMLMARPIYWLRFITEHKSTIAPGNNSVFRNCIKKITQEDMKSLDLSSLRVVLNGSEPIDYEVIELFYEKYRQVGFKKTSMIPCYGLAEASLAVTIHPVGKEPVFMEFDGSSLYIDEKVVLYDKVKNKDKNPVKLTSLGIPINCIELRIFNTKGEIVSEGYIGRICVKGKSVMKEYFLETKLTQEVFQNGWLFTGDVGFIYNRCLYFTGREKELVVIRGKNHSAIDIETIIQKIIGINMNCVAYGYMDIKEHKEALGIFIELDEKFNDKIENIKNNIQKAILRHFEIRADKITVLTPNSIPKTNNGKIRRLDCVQLYSNE